MKKRLLILVSILLINIFSISTPMGKSLAAEDEVTASLDKSSPYAGQQVALTIGYNCQYIVLGSIIKVQIPDGLIYNKKYDNSELVRVQNWEQILEKINKMLEG